MGKPERVTSFIGGLENTSLIFAKNNINLPAFLKGLKYVQGSVKTK